MAKTLRARLWLGYLLLILLVLGAFLLGLGYILNGSTVLYRQVVTKLESTQQLILGVDNSSSRVDIEKIKSVLLNNSIDKSIRVIVTSNVGVTLFDNQQENSVNLRWLRLNAIKRAADRRTAGLTRDSLRRVWIFVATKIPDSQNYIVVASQRQNLTWKFMFSDPMTRLVLRVVVWALLVSLLLTVLMDRWIALPIRKMAGQAALINSENGSQMPVEGVKEVRDLAVALNKMSRQVRESQQSQRDFISDVSHELKTPLTSIQGFSTAILDGTAATPGEISHSAEIISAESQRMLGMVNELLTLARLEGKVEKFESQPSDIKSLISGAIEKLTPAANQGQVRIISKIPELPTIKVDPEGITRVFLNLLDNAIKFSPPGSEVTLTGEIKNGEILIQITDTGPGIAAEELPKIFNRFYQVDRSRKSGTVKSSGLGLTIAREIVRAHSGDISVASTPGKGTSFTIHLQLKQN